MPFDSFGQVRPPEIAEIGQNVRNQRFFETCAFPGCFFVTGGRIDLGIGSYERYWPVDVPFDSFGQVRPPEMAEIGQNVRNQRFFETCAFPGCFFVTDGRIDLGISSYERSWHVDVPLTVSARFGHRKWPKLAKMSEIGGFSKPELYRLFPCNGWS